MQVGNLIRTTRAMPGIPAGALALIIKVVEHVHTVKFIGAASVRQTRRLLTKDLEVVSG
jgi:hypothetical protein